MLWITSILFLIVKEFSTVLELQGMAKPILISCLCGSISCDHLQYQLGISLGPFRYRNYIVIKKSFLYKELLRYDRRVTIKI